MEKVTAEIKAEKKYVKAEDIKNALVERSYKKDDPISFNLYKLGANYIRLNSAPLEEEVYVVANTYLLDGKEVTLNIKEKEAVLVGADADLMVVEAKENGAEITTLKATVENGMAKVKVKLRPKTDEDLKKWKEKLANGIKDGTHKYIVKSTFTVSGDLDKIASTIEKKSNEALASKHTVKKADISALLAEGTTYPAGTLLDFPKYKKAEEMLWLKAECQGDIKKHEGEFLKRDGEYLVIGQDKCVCKEYDLIWGDKVSCDFRKKVVEMSKNLGLPQKNNEGANWLMTIMALETAYTFSPKCGSFGKNPDESSKYKYIGLIQFGKAAAEEVGTTRTHLMSLTAEKQLEFVEKHFKLKQFKGLLNNKTALYLSVNYPNATKFASDKDHVVYDSTKDAYDDNPMFKREAHEFWIDRKGKKQYNSGIQGSSYVWEFEEALEEVENTGKSHKSKIFSCGLNNNIFNDIVTYHIHEDGTIEKHIPKIIKEEYKQKYKYVYHDKEKNKHEICIVDWITADKRNNGQRISSIPEGYIKTYDYPSGGNAQTAYEYTNGDICVSGTQYGYRKFPKGNGQVQLIRMKDSLSYKNGETTIFYSFHNSKRRYCNPDAYAGFIGTLAKLGREDVLCTGMCFADATSYPSVTHPNGDCADTAYYPTLALEQKKVDAFKFFHFEKIYRGNTSWYSNLIGTIFSSGHEDHLHSGEFNTNVVIIIEEK